MNEAIDGDGFRPNVGIILSNARSHLLLAGRAGQRGWQFPQGGIEPDEAPLDAMYRELREEVGLAPADVQLLGSTEPWLRYRLPRRYMRRRADPVCVGQKQIWYLLRLLARDEAVQLDRTAQPEFDRWRWVDYWQPVHEVIYFKKRVYLRALKQLAPILFPDGQLAPPPRIRRRGQMNGSPKPR
jgi:putative (di)nucleoside polyphosphate hydrolase